jgi:LPS O-antigen subunit length determinant protein (WzzB/FepE family)
LILNGLIFFKLKTIIMKTTLFIGLVVSMMAASCSNENDILTAPAVNQVATKTDASTARGLDCKVAYERKCNFGNSIDLYTLPITNMTDVENYCRQTTISCAPTECTARLAVLFGMLPGSPKVDSCLPAGYRGK